MKNLDKSLHAKYATQEVLPSDASSKPSSLRLNFENKLPDSEIALKPSLVFGRGYSEAPVDVDLTQFGGQQQGVSRRHLTVIQTGAKIYIKDMASSNGSYLNGQRLTPHTFYELHNGDRIKLGLLVFKVQFNYAKKSSEKLPVKSHEPPTQNYDLDKTYVLLSQIVKSISSDNSEEND
jgi:pSer/pThr/pTyr-binding forkhead associated (FHA) protein